MKISVFGLKPFSQLIKEGFQKLGHEISSENLDLIARAFKKEFLNKI